MMCVRREQRCPAPSAQPVNPRENPVRGRKPSEVTCSRAARMIGLEGHE